MGHGAVITLGDRDCTLQRRNQKVIEEAPAPGLTTAVRERLARAAAALCSRAWYRSAGTVEFVYDRERDAASFLEVNARLQVEHTVTEEVYGIDLVEWMLRLAQGDRSMFDVPALVPGSNGICHAMQARVSAEDPAVGYRPSAGLITEVRLPEALRVDAWVETGTEVSVAYDPLLGKLIAGGGSREEALRRLAAGLRETRIEGITISDFCRRRCAIPRSVSPTTPPRPSAGSPTTRRESRSCAEGRSRRGHRGARAPARRSPWRSDTRSWLWAPTPRGRVGFPRPSRGSLA